MIAERLWAMMGRSPVSHPGADQLLAGLARLGIATPQLETLGAMLATPDLAEKLAHQTASATQALHEARALAAEAQRDRVAAEAAWREADRIEAELEAASAAHAARSAELDSRAHVIETREREIEKTLHDLAALKAKYESKLAAIEAIVKDPSADGGYPHWHLSGARPLRPSPAPDVPSVALGRPPRTGGSVPLPYRGGMGDWECSRSCFLAW